MASCMHAENMGTIMDDVTEKNTCVLHGLKLVRRWLDELESRSRNSALDLMNLVMAGKLTNDEAFALLDNTGGCATDK
jgi:hypothetical protein